MKRDYAADYGRFSGEHWWFQARRLILKTLLGRIRFPPRPAITEIGVGDGRNLYALYPQDALLTGIEPDAATAETARGRGPVPVLVATAEKLPQTIPDGSQDAICLFDVLEHTQNDLLAIEHLARKLKPGGRLILTVPAYMFLWGQQDEVSLHYRRYTKRSLAAKLRKSGFTIERATYFNTLLFPPIAAFRLLARLIPHRKSGSGSDFEYTAGTLDRLMFCTFAFERHLLSLMNFPFGVSIYVESRRESRST